MLSSALEQIENGLYEVVDIYIVSAPNYMIRNMKGTGAPSNESRWQRNSCKSSLVLDTKDVVVILCDTNTGGNDGPVYRIMGPGKHFFKMAIR